MLLLIRQKQTAAKQTSRFGGVNRLKFRNRSLDPPWESRLMIKGLALARPFAQSNCRIEEVQGAEAYEIAMSIGKPLFIGFPWARRFGDRRSLFLHCESCGPDSGINFRQIASHSKTG